jgi:hypothetical protein
MSGSDEGILLDRFIDYKYSAAFQKSGKMWALLHRTVLVTAEIWCIKSGN